MPHAARVNYVSKKALTPLAPRDPGQGARRHVSRCVMRLRDRFCGPARMRLQARCDLNSMRANCDEQVEAGFSPTAQT